MAEVIRVLLVDDDPMVRAGLRYMLQSAPDIEVVGEAGDGAEVVPAVRQCVPHVVLMDLRMPGTDGIVATEAVRSLPNPPHVIALTTWDVDDAVMGSLAAGASGFLLKTSGPDEIMHAIRSVVSGDAVLSPRSTRQLIDRLARDGASQARRDAAKAMRSLTAREREVAVAVAHGWTNSEIAQKLFIAEATVKAHLAAMQTKLGVRNRVDIAVLAERAGLVAP